MSTRQKPQFTSAIPPHLLEGSRESEKFIMEQLSVMGQKSDWLMNETGRQSDLLEAHAKQLDGVDEKVSYTNGKVRATLLQLKELEDKNIQNKERDEELAQIILAKKFAERYMFNKYSFLALCVFILGAIQVIRSQQIRELFVSLIG